MCVLRIVSVILNWVCWVRGNFSGGLGHIFSANSVVWNAGPVQFYLGTLLVWMAGLYRFFLSLWLCSSGYGTVEMVKGVVRFFLLSPVCCQFSWRLDVCGRIFCVIFFDFLW